IGGGHVVLQKARTEPSETKSPASRPVDDVSLLPAASVDALEDVVTKVNAKGAATAVAAVDRAGTAPLLDKLGPGDRSALFEGRIAPSTRQRSPQPATKRWRGMPSPRTTWCGG